MVKENVGADMEKRNAERFSDDVDAEHGFGIQFFFD